MAISDVVIDLNFAPSVVEAGDGTYPIGYVRLLSSTGEPIIAQSNIEVELVSGDASIAFVPSRVMIPAGSDYVGFDVEVSDLAGATEISALYGNQVVSRPFKVVNSQNPVQDIKLVINLPSEKMQVASEMPFSIYFENGGNIVQAPKDITVELDYESSLIDLDSDSLVIMKGSYYATAIIKTLQKSGNAFIKATAEADTSGKLISTVTNVEISQTQPVSLKVHVFPDKVGLNENNIDIFVGVLDASGRPTLAAEDIKLDLFSSAYQLSGIDDVSAVIKKGEFGFYTRQYMNFYSAQIVTIGASAQGLGAGTTTFEVLEDTLSISNPKALDKMLKVFTVQNMPSDASAIVVYQLHAIEHDDDDCVEEDGTLIEKATEEETSVGTGGTSGSAIPPNCVDIDGNGKLDHRDWHPIDELKEGETYPIESESIYSQSQGNLNIVSGNNMAAQVIDPGYIASGSSFGTAMISSGRQANDVDISVSLANIAVGENSLTVIGGLNPTQTKIFSPSGKASDGNYRALFDRNGFTDLYFVVLDFAGRPSNSDQGVKYLIKPVNELTEIMPGLTFARLHVNEDSFTAGDAVAENKIDEISAIPVGVNSDSELETTSKMHLLFHTGTTAKVLLPFDSAVAFSKVHQIGVVQLTDVSGNPVLAADDITIRLTSSSVSNVLPESSLIIPNGKSFVIFDIATFGRADNFTIYSSADGLQSSSTILEPVVAELPASFISPNTFATSVPAEITVSTPIEGASIMWGASSSLQLIGNTTTFIPAGNSYTATMQVVSDVPGTFTVDATLVKDGFKPTRISKELVIGPYQKQMNIRLLESGLMMLSYNQPIQMQVSVHDSSGMPVSGATVQVEDTGPQGMTLVSSVSTDANGAASFVYMPTRTEGSSNSITLLVTAHKDGYQSSRDSKVFEIDESTAILPPIPVIGSAFVGLPSWTSYAMIGGIAAVGGGLYLLKRPKDHGEEESLVVEDAGAIEVATEETEEIIEEAMEDEEEET
ncbi:MAG TPA: carboxypeptidase-like regulatory domain-containing protein [Nitrososphaera sp.]|nr:carboxypeptidase-like regulatory domain-containing protein [Nitrososphaera sp.]